MMIVQTVLADKCILQYPAETRCSMESSKLQTCFMFLEPQHIPESEYLWVLHRQGGPCQMMTSTQHKHVKGHSKEGALRGDL